PRTVPAGEYAIESLSHLQLNETLKAKFILAKDVRQVLSYVARGEVEAGFVYKSDMESAAAKGAKIIEDIPRENHKPIEYFLSAIAGSKQQDKAKKLLSYFEGPKAAVIWKKFGFRTPSEKAATAVEPTPFKGKVSAPN
ncbi:MAG: molybdate ABC transporter substrate-binding protein, partial [Proteobacteria bacterium]